MSWGPIFWPSLRSSARDPTIKRAPVPVKEGSVPLTRPSVPFTGGSVPRRGLF